MQANKSINSIDAWTQAEQTAMKVLCECTGMTLGKSAFIGEVDNIANSFYFYNEQTKNGGEVFYAKEQPTFVLAYSATSIFLSRADAQRWAMKIIKSLPVRNIGNVALFRLSNTAIGSITIKEFDFQNETEPRLAYELTLNFDLVVCV